MDSITEETAMALVTAVRAWLTEQVAKALPDIIDEKVEAALTKSNTEAAIERGIRCALEDSSIDLYDVLNRVVKKDIDHTLIEDMIRDSVETEIDRANIDNRVEDAVLEKIEDVDLEDLLRQNCDFTDVVQTSVDEILGTHKDDIQQQITESVRHFAASAIYEQVSLAAKAVVEKETSGVHIAVKAAAEKAAKAHVEKMNEDGGRHLDIIIEEAVRLTVTEVLPQHVEVCVEQRFAKEFSGLRNLVKLIKIVRSFVVNEWQD